MSNINKNEHTIEYNFIFKTIYLLMDFYNFFYLLFFLNNSSFNLTILLFFVQAFKLLSDFLLKKYTDYKNRTKQIQLQNKYNSALYEFIDNMRLIKSMGIEDVQFEKLIPMKNEIGIKFCSLDGILDPFIDFIHKMLDNFIIFIEEKYNF